MGDDSNSSTSSRSDGTSRPTRYQSTSASSSSAGSTSRTGLPPSTSSHPSLLLLTTSTTSMPPPAIPPQQHQSRTMKQRRVSLPGTSAHSEILGLSEREGGAQEQMMHTINGWGVSFRDDLGLPTSNNETTSSSQVAGGTMPGVNTRSASASFSNTYASAATEGGANDQPQQPSHMPATSTVVTRRRRATTVAAKGRTRGEFAVPADPVPQQPVVEAPPSATAARAPPSAETGGSSNGTTPPLDDATPGGPTTSKPRKPRKRWTMEETQHLVDGCNKWGVGNWKAILNDTQFQFQGRSPVDLKDRFRTYFPDAYRTHYPNAKTHLSTRIRSFLPDGTPIFAKTRSKKRRPFSAEEDAALRRGYEKYGTTWATIVKDPVFKGMERRSTDLRDRFRNAFPDLYKAAGYKPRPRAGTTSSATSATPGEASGSTIAKGKETKRGRKSKAEPALAEASRSTSKSTSRVASSSSRRKRTSGAPTGERPIAPGEPTAADFYRPHQTHDDDDDDDQDARQPSESEGGYSSEEEDADEDDHYYPLSAVSTNLSVSTPGLLSPTRSEQVLDLTRAWSRNLSGTTMTDDGDDEEDMDVDGDVILSHSPPDEDSGLDGTELSSGQNYGRSASASTRRTSTSEAGPSGSALSPPMVSQAIQELLNSASAMMNGNSGGPSGDGGYTEGPPYNPNGGQSFLQSASSSSSIGSSVRSDDWNPIGPHNGYQGPTNNLTNGSGPTAWMTGPTSPTPSDFYHHHPSIRPGLESSGSVGGGVLSQSPPGPSTSRIGKSAWGPQDWLSNNPRLDHNLNILAGNGALTSWPTPASDPHAVLDRYDLYSAVEAAHEFASEAAYGHHNHASHAHTYPDDSVFREFTHHRYAGDLIPGSGVAVHPPHLALQQSGLGQGAWSFGSLGLGLAALGGLDTASLPEDYASSVTSGSGLGLAGLRGALRDVDEVSLSNYTSGSTAPSGAASPIKLPTNPPSVLMNGPQLEARPLDLDAMILVDSEDGPGSGIGLTLSQTSHGAMEQLAGSQSQSSMDLHLGIPSPSSQVMEEAGAVTPTSFPASLPCPPSPLRIDQPRLPTVDFSHHRKHAPSTPHRPHSRSVTQGHPPQAYRPTTPMASRDASRSFSQPPSEHRLALQRSLSYLDPITSSHAASAGLFGPFVDEDPLAYNEPLSISSLDLQYGMSAGPNIFTPLTMFTEPQTIAPARTIHNGFNRNHHFGNRPTPTPPPSQNTFVEEALDINALIHTSPIPAPRNHQRHQSQSVTPHGDVNMRKSEVAKKRSSWDGFQLDLLPHGATQDESSFFMEFTRSSQ